jgi:hypothetical protein
MTTQMLAAAGELGKTGEPGKGERSSGSVRCDVEISLSASMGLLYHERF